MHLEDEICQGYVQDAVAIFSANQKDPFTNLLL